MLICDLSRLTTTYAASLELIPLITSRSYGQESAGGSDCYKRKQDSEKFRNVANHLRVSALSASFKPTRFTMDIGPGKKLSSHVLEFSSSPFSQALLRL